MKGLHELGVPYNWNMNLAYLMQLDRRRDEKAQAAMSGDRGLWWACLWEIYESISPLINKEEDKGVKDKLNDVYVELQSLMETGYDPTAVGQYMRSELFNNTAEKMREAGRIMTDLMFKYGIIDMKRKDKSVEERLRDGTRNR